MMEAGIRAAKSEYRNPKLEIHPPEAGKNSKHEGLNAGNRTQKLTVLVVWISVIVSDFVLRISDFLFHKGLISHTLGH